jgi:Transposase DDE domain
VFVQGYNPQIAVSDDHLVVACDISTDNVDHALLEPMIDAVYRELGPDENEIPMEFLADAGYWKGEAVERLRECGKKVLVPPNGRPRTRNLGGSSIVTTMTEQLADPDTAKRYRRRQALVEPVIAHIKHNRRLDRFLLRGITGARLEWTLGCTAHNLKRLAQAV